MDEPGIRDQIRLKLRAGILPHRPPTKMWAGPGTNRRCAICDAAITRAEIEVEAERPGGGNLYFHQRCEVLWQAEALES